MAKRLTIAQLRRAVETAPGAILTEGKIFLQRGLSEYKRAALQSSPWRIGQSGGGVPRDTGNLRERHRTEISGLEGRFGVSAESVRYASFVHQGTSKMEARPWLDSARQRANSAVEKHYKVFMDNILAHIAT